jgi:hypothetical protein
MSHSKKGGLQWEQAEVEQFYKGYRIAVSVTLDGVTGLDPESTGAV